MLIKHFFREYTQPTTWFRRTDDASTTPWFWQVLGITTFLCLWLTSEGLAQTAVNPTSLTFYAVQGGANPPNQTLNFSRVPTHRVTLNATDNASWVSESPASSVITTTAKVTVAVNTSGRGAGTYRGTVTLKLGTWTAQVVPVTLIISPATSPTSRATLAWNAVTGTPITGYRLYVGEAPNNYTRTINVGNVTSSTVSGLTVGRMYYFAVTAYNSAGESARSNMVSRMIQ